MSKELIDRPLYSNRIKKLKDQNIVKILAGIRRCGKRSILKLVQNDFIKEGVKKENIIEYDFSLIENENLNYLDLSNEILEKYQDEKIYLFFDEIQELKGWEKLVNSLMTKIDCDIYLTGSNASLLEDSAKYLSGRFVIFNIFPLSFKEFLSFQNIDLQIKNNKDLTNKYFLKNTGSSLKNFFNRYIRYGGFPEISRNRDTDMINILLENLYLTVFIKDLINNRKDSKLFERIIRFLSDSIGNLITTKKMTDTLISSSIFSGGKGKTLSRRTVHSYLDLIVITYLFYPAARYEIKGKSYLTTSKKFYTTDTGIRNFLLEYKNDDRGFLYENTVFMELKRRNFTVSVGKNNNQEIDFRAFKNNKEFLIQVTESLNDSNVKNREVAAFKNVKAYKKIIITVDDVLPDTIIEDDISVINIIDFLLDERYLDEDLLEI